MKELKNPYLNYKKIAWVKVKKTKMLKTNFLGFGCCYSYRMSRQNWIVSNKIYSLYIFKLGIIQTWRKSLTDVNSYYQANIIPAMEPKNNLEKLGTLSI